MDWRNLDEVREIAELVAEVKARAIVSQPRAGRMHIAVSARDLDAPPPIRLLGRDVVTSRRLPADVVQVRRYHNDSIEVIGEIGPRGAAA